MKAGFTSWFRRKRSVPSAEQLARSLTEIRERLFGLCLNVVEQVQAEHPERRVSIVNSSLTGKADLALRAFQLIDASSFIESRRYLEKHNENTYLDSFRAAIWGAEEPRIIEDYFVRYLDAEISRSPDKSSIMRLADDLASHVMGRESLMSEMVMIAPIIPMFSALTYVEIARAFGDREETNRIERELRKRFQ